MTSETASGPGPVAFEALDDQIHDVLFVHNLVLPCAIGVHDDEQGQHQRVRFNIDIAIRAGSCRDARKPVVDYDAVIAAVHDVMRGGHIGLVETLAERVADRCLAFEGAERVKTRVEKLDRVPGASLGVEIVRHRRAAGESKVVPLNPVGDQ